MGIINENQEIVNFYSVLKVVMVVGIVALQLLVLKVSFKKGQPEYAKM